MNYLSYKQIQTIQDNTTKKLIDYINDFLEDDKGLDSVEFYFPNFDDQKTRIAFNVWISTDYKTIYDKTFIEHMLEDRSNDLSSIEREILIERNKSYISLFEVYGIEGEYIELIDLLTRKEYMIWEPRMAEILKPSDLIFGRIGKVIQHKSFIGNVSFLPPSIKDSFIEEVLLDYNYIRLKYGEIQIDEYLKQYSVNLYRIYTDAVYDALDIDEDPTSVFYDEIEEFEGYLQTIAPRATIKKHITNLINLYEFYFLEDDITLYQLAEMDMNELFEDAIKEGFINSQVELSSYISTLKKYLKFLKSIEPEFRGVYEDLLKISKNRFLYTNTFKKIKPPFDINRKLSRNIAHVMNEKAFRFIMDFERFLVYIMNSPLQVTAARKYIKRKDLIDINKSMENQSTIEKKAPNQEDFKMIHLFYNFAMDNELIALENNQLQIARKGPQFLRITDEEKYSLLMEYTWSSKFLSNLCKNDDMDYIENMRNKTLELLDGLQPSTPYRLETLLPNSIDFPKFPTIQSKHLDLMGLVRKKDEPYPSISITNLGKTLFKVLILGDDFKEKSAKIIDLNDRREIYNY